MLGKIAKNLGTLVTALTIAGSSVTGCVHTYTGPLPSVYNFPAQSDQELYSNLEYLLNQANNIRPNSCKASEIGFACDFAWYWAHLQDTNYERVSEDFSKIARVNYQDAMGLHTVSVFYKSPNDPTKEGTHPLSSKIVYDDRFKAIELHNVLNEILKRKSY